MKRKNTCSLLSVQAQYVLYSMDASVQNTSIERVSCVMSCHRLGVSSTWWSVMSKTTEAELRAWCLPILLCFTFTPGCPPTGFRISFFTLKVYLSVLPLEYTESIEVIVMSKPEYSFPLHTLKKHQHISCGKHILHVQVNDRHFSTLTLAYFNCSEE